MPVTKTETTGPQSGWGLWCITESEADLSYLSFESCPEEIFHPEKRLEYLAGRALAKSLVESLGMTYEGLGKDQFGKPFLKSLPHGISLSHSYPYVAAQVAHNQSVGIDVEQIKEKLRQVGPRVLSPVEMADADGNLVKLCIYWCAKEALYKIHGKRNVLFSHHLDVKPFELAETGTLFARIDIAGAEQNVSLRYHVTKSYVVVFTDSKQPL